MKTQLLLQIVFIALVITFNSDLKVYANKAFDFISNFLFGGKGNICRL